MSLSQLYNIDNLYKALIQIQKASGWKETTQRYMSNFLTNLTDLSERLQNGTYKPTKPKMFLINERGKIRLIESYTVEDRIVQNCLVNEILLPAIKPYLIYDNSASLKGRGTGHFRNRLELKLCRFAKKYGSNGYILLGDFTKYFDNLLHCNFLAFLRHCGCDEEVVQFVDMLLKEHVVYVADDTVPFNSVEYYQGLNHGNIRVEKGAGIGSMLAQIAGICGACYVDNLLSIVLGLQTGRYMDDFYALSRSKEELVNAKKRVEQEVQEKGMFLNPKKTQIVPLSHEFTILHTTYRIKGHTLIKRPDKKTFVRERRKLKKLTPKVISGKMPQEMFEARHQSWKGDINRRFCNTQSLKNIESLYEEELGCIQSHLKTEQKSKT